VIRRLFVLAMLVLCAPDTWAQQPGAADPKGAAAAEIKAADAQVQKDRAQLEQRHRELDGARKSGDRDKIDTASAAVRDSQKQLRGSRAKRDAARTKLAALEKPERDAAKARGNQIRAERAKRNAARSKEKAERRAAKEKAQKDLGK